ncbi:MAG: hypothetical protein WC600_18990 [Desulfobaccales bacterium]
MSGQSQRVAPDPSSSRAGVPPSPARRDSDIRSRQGNAHLPRDCHTCRDARVPRPPGGWPRWCAENK